MYLPFDVYQLLLPYEEGGSENSPVKRSISTIANALVVKNRLPTEIVGAAIFKVLNEMAFKGLEFKGDGTYGSKGDELYQCIKAQAVDITEKKNTLKVIDEIREMAACVNQDCKRRTISFPIKNKRYRVKRFLFKARGWWNV